MNYKLIIAAWFILAISIVYWDINRWKDPVAVSECHNVEIKIIHDKPMCTECKMYCKIKK